MTRPSVSTATGDTGETGLYGGARISKAHPRLQAYGDVDELNSLLGVCLNDDLPVSVAGPLSDVQATLFTVGADLATPLDAKSAVPRIEQQHIVSLEEWGTALEADLEPLQHFVLPGGAPGAARLHQARAVCRRAERWVAVLLQQGESVNDQVLVYLNRLSDVLFLAARTVNKATETKEPIWQPPTA